MKKFIMLLFIVLSTASCSLLPKVNFNTPNTVPQATQKSKLKEVCKGEATFNTQGDIISCTKGYVNYAENYTKQERRMTIIEKIKNFINKLVGFGFWGLVLLIIFVPGLLGVVLGRIVEGTIGLGAKCLKAVVKGVQRARKQGKPLDEALDSELDEKYKKYIRDMKAKEGIK